MAGKIFTTGMGTLNPVGRKAEEALYSLKNAGSDEVTWRYFIR
jgi:hypothetical protein